MKTIRETLIQSTASLKVAGIETPNLDASLLLAYTLNTSRTLLITRGTEEISEEDYISFCSLIDRRLKGECIAYILGKKEFRGLEFLVNRAVLVPRPDTETLIEAVLEIMNNEKTAGNSVLDLCTGSGAIAIALKNEMPNLEVHASDICAEALETAKNNAKYLLGKDQIHFYHGDLFGALPVSCGLFSLVISNPPYIPSALLETLSAEVKNEPSLALDGGKDGLEIIRRIIKDAPFCLQNGGILLLEADPHQMGKISVLLDKNGFYGVKLYKDLSGQERAIAGKYEKKT